MSKNVTYVAAFLSESSDQQLRDWCQQHQILVQVKSILHCTLCYSRTPLHDLELITQMLHQIKPVVAYPERWTHYGEHHTVLEIQSEMITGLHKMLKHMGASHDYSLYNPHVTVNDQQLTTLPISLPPVLTFDRFEVQLI